MPRPPLESFAKEPEKDLKPDSKEEGESVVQFLRGKKGDIGPAGRHGKDGKTPSKEELEQIIVPLIPYVEDGKTPTEEELTALIKPLIPKVKDGKTPSSTELLNLIQPLIPEVKDGITPSKEELTDLVKQIVPKFELDTGKEIIDKINNNKSAKLKLAKIQGLEDIQNQAASTEKRIQNFLSLGGSRSTAIKVSGTLLGTGINTVNFVGATGTKVGDGSEVNITTSGSGTGIVQTIVAGTGISVNSTDPANPIVTATGSGSGTVTSVSVTTANGVSGSVATATTTPAITLTLGAITPTSVNSVVLSGSTTPTLTVTGTTAVSGTNTGDQTTSGTSNRISVTNGSTNPTIDISASYVGQTSITTLGTITTGTWTATTIAVANGGTGQTTANNAFNALAPAQSTNSGKFLTTDGTNTSWATVSGTGTVTSVTSADANATVANTTTTPVITIVSAPKWATARNLAGNSVDGSANVAFANKFIVQGTTDVGLSAAQFLGALTTGIVKNTTTTGVLSIAVAGDFPTLNQSTTGSAATLTTARTIGIATGDATSAGSTFDGSANNTNALTLATVNGNVGSFTSANITVNAKGLITAAANGSGGTGISWTEVTGTTQTAAVNNGYILNNASLVTLTLPSTAAVGSIIEAAGKGAGGWKIAQNASGQIHYGNVNTTSGTGGSLASVNQYDSIRLVCIVANNEWVVLSSQGNITIV